MENNEQFFIVDIRPSEDVSKLKISTESVDFTLNVLVGLASYIAQRLRGKEDNKAPTTAELLRDLADGADLQAEIAKKVADGTALQSKEQLQ